MSSGWSVTGFELVQGGLDLFFTSVFSFMSPLCFCFFFIHPRAEIQKREKPRESESETERDLFHPLVHFLNGCNGQCWARPELGAFLGLPCWCMGSGDLGYLLLISQAIGPEPDGRWKSWESNQHAYRMLGLQAVGLQTIPQYWPFGLFVHSAVRAGSAKRARELINSPHAQSCRATCAAVSECHKILFNVTVAGHICFWVSAFCSEAAGLPPSVIQC